MDKRKTQMSLPLEVPKNKVKDYAKQHWNVTFARQKKVSVAAKRIMSHFLSQIQENDLKFAPYYQMHASEVIEAKDKRGMMKDVKKAFKELATVLWWFEDWENEILTPRNLLDTTKSVKKDGFECGYKQGLITLVPNPVLEEYFIAIAKNYTTYQLKWYMSFKSWYSMRLYELLSAFKDSGEWYVNIDEFRELMDCEKKYAKTPDLLNKTLQEPLEELKRTDMAFSYEQVLGEKWGKGRKPVVGLHFTLKKTQPKKIPKAWFEYSDEHKKVLFRLLDYGITEKNITKYAKAIGIDQSRALLRAWDDKERSDERIDNKTSYCNAVWCRVGKERS